MSGAQWCACDHDRSTHVGSGGPCEVCPCPEFAAKSYEDMTTEEALAYWKARDTGPIVESFDIAAGESTPENQT